jgi:hypothetical protein
MESIFGLWFAFKSKLMFLDQTVPFVYHSFQNVVKIFQCALIYHV